MGKTKRLQWVGFQTSYIIRTLQTLCCPFLAFPIVLFYYHWIYEESVTSGFNFVLCVKWEIKQPLFDVVSYHSLCISTYTSHGVFFSCDLILISVLFI